MQANCTARNAPILTYESILMSMSCHRLYENESTFGLEYNLDWSCFDLSKCNSNSNFSSISVFCKSANFNSNLICYSCVSSNFNSNLISKSKKNFICPSLPATAEIEKWLRSVSIFSQNFEFRSEWKTQISAGVNSGTVDPWPSLVAWPPEMRGLWNFSVQV